MRSTGDEIRDRLGIYRFDSRRAVKAAAGLIEGEHVDAVAVACWKRRGWVLVASDSGLRLVRRPRLLGRARDERFDWADLTAVRSGPQRVELTFGDRALRLLWISPDDEFVRLLSTARRRLAGDNKRVTADEIRTLARRDLGRLLTLGFEPIIDGAPDRLEPGERVERVAGATLDFGGMLVITDRRVLLLDIPLRTKWERIWSVARRDIRNAVLVEDGLRLELGDRALTLTRIVPPERLVDLAFLLPLAADEPRTKRAAMKCPGCGVEVLGDLSCPGCGAALPVRPRPAVLPSQRWELTAPESYLLRYVGCGVRDVGAFRLALIELVARQALRLEGAWIGRSWGPGTRFVWLLGDGPRMASVTEPALAPVLALYGRVRERRLQVGLAYRDPAVEVEGVLVKDLIKTGARRRDGFRDYLHADVAESLQRRGFLSATRERTAAGNQADQQLDTWLQLGKRQFPRRSYDADQSWARAYLHGAGAAILLVDDAYPALAHVGRRLSPSQSCDEGFAIAIGPERGDGDGDGDGSTLATPDELGAIDFAGLDHALASLAGLDGALGILDASFAGAGADLGGGGDAGGF